MSVDPDDTTEPTDPTVEPTSPEPTEPAPAEPEPGDAVQVDPSTPPTDVIRALGYDPAAVQSVVLTATGVIAVAAEYPTTDPQEVPDADA